MAFIGKYRSILLFAIIVISFLMHLRHLNKELMSVHVWRQTQTQSTINNFYEEDFNILNPRKNDRGNTDGIFRMEFPLMQWMVALMYKIFGPHLIITRLFMFLLGIISVLGMYKLCKVLFNDTTIGVLAAYTFTFSPCFFYYTINPLPDNMALAFGILGIALFFDWKKKRKWYLFALSSIALSIATLCKLPFILFYIVPGIFLIRELLKRDSIKMKGFMIGSVILLIPVLLPAIWYIKAIPTWGGNGITSGVLENQITWQKTFGILWDNLTIVLPEMLLNYGSVLFFIAGFYFLFKKKKFKHPDFYLIFCLSLGVSFYFFFELNMISNVHDYYLFPFLPLLFIIVSYGVGKLLSSNKSIFRVIAIIALISLPILTELRMAIRWNDSNPGVNKDLYFNKNELRNAVPKDALCIAGSDVSHFIMLYYIDKKGWCFDEKDPAPNIPQMINEGAEYLYLDATKIDDPAYFYQYTDSLVMQKGSISVYRLIKN